MTTILSDMGTADVEGRAVGDDLWLSASDTAKITG